MELLIVIMVIATLALIIIPRVMGAVRKSRESALRENLHILRTAITHFSADTGLFPSALTDLASPKTDPPANGINDNGDTEAIPAGIYLGPYLNISGGIGTTGVPVNPFKSPRDADFYDETAHWSYGTDPGIVHSATPIEGSTLDGIPYSDL